MDGNLFCLNILLMHLNLLHSFTNNFKTWCGRGIRIPLPKCATGIFKLNYSLTYNFKVFGASGGSRTPTGVTY